MTETPTPKEALKALAADLEELGVDVIDVVADPEPQRIRVIAEADSSRVSSRRRAVMFSYFSAARCSTSNEASAAHPSPLSVSEQY